MKILMAASELAPFARTGDFADEMRELAGHLRALGHEVTVVLPFYRSVREDKSLKTRKTKTKFSVQVGGAKLPCEIHESTGDVPVLFVARDEFFDRSGLYGTEGRDYQDNSARFIFFTKCVVELARRLGPDVLHAHGWQTALAPVFARDQRLPLVTVLTPHSLEFQGHFWSYDFGLTNLSGDYFSARGVEFYGSINCLKGGILFADAVVLPGRRYVAEMQTPEFGCGLENVLRENSHKLEGIPDGLFETAWPVVPGDPKSREALLETTGLLKGGRILLSDSAATNGAGLDLLLAALDRLPSDEARVLLLGPVPAAHRQALEIALRRHAGRFAHREHVDGALFQNALAGSDFLLLPGPVEPGGEMLMLALRNGLVPVAAHCGGLRQFVQDFDPVRNSGNGYVFYRTSLSALVDAIDRAFSAPADVHVALAETARSADFSWTAAASRHVNLYGRLLRQAGRAIAA
ncbi:MAG: glycogen/starch synthase [Terrimicrobiaceae bacterium]|nr:glycogen/starch synthase [Terrimicrobiaceae bacterium]